MLEIAAELAHDRPGLRGHGAEVRRALPVDRLVDGAPGRRHRHVGRGGRLLLRRAPPARRPGRSGSRSGRWSACCPSAPPPSSTASCSAKYPELAERLRRFLDSRPELTRVHPRPDASPASPAAGSPPSSTRPSSAACWPKMLDENEFLSPYGIRSLSRYHADHPYVIHAGGQEYRVSYLPAESDTGMFGGNSNWRGPIWMPVNALIIRALLQYYPYYGDDFTVECPTGSGRQMNLYQVAEEIARRLAEHLPARTRTAAGRSSAAPRSSRTTRTGATASCSTSTSTATTAPASAPATRPAGPASSPASCTCSPTISPEARRSRLRQGCRGIARSSRRRCRRRPAACGRG